MGKAIKTIGCVVFALLVFVPPVCLTLAIVYEWLSILQLIFVCMCGMEFWAIAYWLLYEMDGEEE